MDIICEKCGTEYEFDEELVGISGTTVKCTQCGHMFKIYRPRKPGEDSFTGWLLKKSDGSVYPFDSLSILQKWIKSNKATQNDQISRGAGGSWKKLGDLPELQPFFEMAKNIEYEQKSKPEINVLKTDNSPLLNQTSKVTPIGMRIQPNKIITPPLGVDNQNKNTSPFMKAQSPVPIAVPEKQPVVQSNKNLESIENSEPDRGSIPTPVATLEPDVSGISSTRESGFDFKGIGTKNINPAWVEDVEQKKERTSKPSISKKVISKKNIQSQPINKTSYDDVSFNRDKRSIFSPRLKKYIFRTVGITLGLIILILLVYFVSKHLNFFKQAGDKIVSNQVQEQPEQFYLRGREYFLLDNDNSYIQADREYNRALVLDSNFYKVYAGLTEVYSTWSQYLLDDRDDNFLQSGKVGKVEEINFLKIQARQNELNFQEKLEQAKLFLDKILNKGDSTLELTRCAISYYRLKGEFETASSYLQKAEKINANDPELIYEKALLFLSQKQQLEIVTDLLEKSLQGNEKLIRVRYRLARIYASEGKNSMARVQLERILQLNNKHVRSEILLNKLNKGESFIIAVYPNHSFSIDDIDNNLSGTLKTDAGLAQDNEQAMDNSVNVNKEVLLEEIQGPPTGKTYQWYVEQGNKLQEAGREKQANDMFSEAIKIRSDGPEALTGLAYSDLAKNSYNSAISKFQRALISNSEYGQAIIGLAEAYKSNGDNMLALEAYRRYLRVLPQGPSSSLAKRQVIELEGILGQSSKTDNSNNSQQNNNNIEPTKDGNSSIQLGPTDNPPVKVEENIINPGPQSDTPAVNSEPPGLVPEND